MRNDKRILSYTLKRLKDAYLCEDTAKIHLLVHDLELMKKLLDDLPEYEAPQVMDVFCVKEEADDE